MKEIKFCSKCGFKISRASNYCENCGYNLNVQNNENLFDYAVVKLIDELNQLLEKGGQVRLELNKRVLKFSKESLSYKLRFDLGTPNEFSELEKSKLKLLGFETSENNISKIYTLSFKEEVFEDIINTIISFDDLSGNIEITYSSQIEKPTLKISKTSLEEKENKENINSIDAVELNNINSKTNKTEKSLSKIIFVFVLIGVVLLVYRYFDEKKSSITSQNIHTESKSYSDNQPSNSQQHIDQNIESEGEKVNVVEEVENPQESKLKNSLEKNPFKGKVFTFKSIINDKEIGEVIIQTNNEKSYHLFDFQKNIIHLFADFQGEQVQFSFPVSGYYIERGLTDETHVFVINTLGVKEIYLSLTNNNLGYDYDDGSRINHFGIELMK
ncbi:zinc ribbon domain-containing protein [Sphingobacterium lactis]|uniref:zinc ribbon domain-containing protein n=1 Tax=Sphingobacterium lactis TaxID=797291 RepID=UPI003EC8C853